ncbi:MAG: type II CRISPR-associated endonuclease Cas1 [Bacteroidetes bacterium]|nr:MAG: type II CRISPR-associated endonuclease Cas1 [Bacteroidota bacterium]
MLKRTIYFSNPVYLRSQNEQLVFNLPNAQGLDEIGKQNTIPIEDIGIVILDHQQITISHGLIAKLLENNVALITCDAKHHPTGLMLNLDGHTLQSARFKAQIEASEPLKKQLWQQTIKSKIANQASMLQYLGIETGNMQRWENDVKSGDAENHEAQAAAYYWKKIFSPLVNLPGYKNLEDFTREREGFYPNNFLNYGYAILRATVARSLVGSGLLPTLGIHHRNQYNAYCLADDIMEPYRPFVDKLVYEFLKENPSQIELTKETKSKLLQIPALDILIDGSKSPLMVGIQKTTYSVYKCYVGESRKITYPLFCT